MSQYSSIVAKSRPDGDSVWSASCKRLTVRTVGARVR
jgi:hypothetical protein